MKLLLTGLPGTGKTTLVQHLITLKPEAFWVVSAEIRDEAGWRVGFSAETSTGIQAVFAHKQSIKSDVRIGDYRINVAALDELFAGPIQSAMQSGQFLIIDEIGRMQMHSSNFAATMRRLFASDCDVVATINYGDDWTKQFTDRDDVLALLLTTENRSTAKAEAESILNSATK